MLRRLLSFTAPVSSHLGQRLAGLEGRLLMLLVRRGQARGEKVAWMQREDALTGLANRVAFEETLRELRQQQVSGALAVLDLDHFKMINDRHGHGAADEVLRVVVGRIRSTVNADVALGRYGGDEIILFIPGSMDRARDLLDRVLSRLRQPIELGQARVGVTASIGLAPLPLSIGLSQGLSSADIAMFAAKTNGRDQVMEFSPETQKAVTARRELARTVAQLQAHNRELQEQVQLDALTGLRSRRALDEVLDMACGGEAPGAEHCGVAFIDIDHFGSYNKHHGDDQGDVVLRRVAQVLQATARRGDLVFRKGGEEFVAVLPGATAEETYLAAERMRSAVELAAIPHQASLSAAVITVTAGVASSQQHGGACTVQDLMNQAAHAAMQAKLQSLRNRVHRA